MFRGFEEVFEIYTASVKKKRSPGMLVFNILTLVFLVLFLVCFGFCVTLDFEGEELGWIVGSFCLIFMIISVNITLFKNLRRSQESEGRSEKGKGRLKLSAEVTVLNCAMYALVLLYIVFYILESLGYMYKALGWGILSACMIAVTVFIFSLEGRGSAFRRYDSRKSKEAKPYEDSDPAYLKRVKILRQALMECGWNPDDNRIIDDFIDSAKTKKEEYSSLKNLRFLVYLGLALIIAGLPSGIIIGLSGSAAGAGMVIIFSFAAAVVVILAVLLACWFANRMGRYKYYDRMIHDMVNLKMYNYYTEYVERE